MRLRITRCRDTLRLRISSVQTPMEQMSFFYSVTIVFIRSIFVGLVSPSCVKSIEFGKILLRVSRITPVDGISFLTHTHNKSDVRIVEMNYLLHL